MLNSNYLPIIFCFALLATEPTYGQKKTVAGKKPQIKTAATAGSEEDKAIITIGKTTVPYREFCMFITKTIQILRMPTPKRA